MCIHIILPISIHKNDTETAETKKVKILHVVVLFIHNHIQTLFPQQGSPTLAQHQVPQYLPLNTTPALYSTLTDVFLDEAKLLDSCKLGMKFDPPDRAGYKIYLDTLQSTGRTINTTVADGNCLYRSISKGLIGTEFYHFEFDQ